MVKMDMYVGEIYSGKTQQVMEQALKEAMKTDKSIVFLGEDRLVERMAAFFGREGVDLNNIPEVAECHDPVGDLSSDTIGQIRSKLADEAILVIDQAVASDDDVRILLNKLDDLLTRVYLVIGQQPMPFDEERARFPSPYHRYDVMKFICYQTKVDGERHFSVKEVK